jgi:hypothetical protein
VVDVQLQAQYLHQFLSDPLGGPPTAPSAREADQFGFGLNVDLRVTRHISFFGQFGGQVSSAGGLGLSPVLFGLGLHSESQYK